MVAGGEDALSGIADLVMALRVPLLVIVPLTIFYAGASLSGNALHGPVAASLMAAGGLVVLGLSMPFGWLVVVGLVPGLLGWAFGRYRRRRRSIEGVRSQG